MCTPRLFSIIMTWPVWIMLLLVFPTMCEASRDGMNQYPHFQLLQLLTILVRLDPDALGAHHENQLEEVDTKEIVSIY